MRFNQRKKNAPDFRAAGRLLLDQGVDTICESWSNSSVSMTYYFKSSSPRLGTLFLGGGEHRDTKPGAKPQYTNAATSVA